MYRERLQYKDEAPEHPPVPLRIPQFGFIAQFDPYYADKYSFFYYQLPKELTDPIVREWNTARGAREDDGELLFALIPKSLPPPIDTSGVDTLDFPLEWFDGDARHTLVDIASDEPRQVTIESCWAGLPTGRRRHVAMLVVSFDN